MIESHDLKITVQISLVTLEGYLLGHDNLGFKNQFTVNEGLLVMRASQEAGIGIQNRDSFVLKAFPRGEDVGLSVVDKEVFVRDAPEDIGDRTAIGVSAGERGTVLE